MMMLLEDGKPVFHKHHCSAERYGQIMTQEELQSFAVEVLYEQYKRCGENIKLLHSGIDMAFIREPLTINIKVVYQQVFDLESCVFDPSPLLKRYYEAGEIPRLVLASAFCEAIPTGMQAICGTNCCFKFCPINLIPDEQNFILPVKFNNLQLAQIYAKAWNDYDAAILEPYLDKNFRYTSDAVFDVMPSRFEYITYFTQKLKTIREENSKSNATLYAQPVKIANSDDHAILILQDDQPDKYVLYIQTFSGRIVHARMTLFEN